MWPCFGSGLPTLTGASHGAAGFAHALTALHHACGQEEFAQAANDCIRYENALFSEPHRNWPDLRQSDSGTRFPCQWCYGAGGIGLARIAMLKNGYPDRSALLSDIERAVRCAKQALSTNDTLCCGDLGNIEFLHEAGILREDKRLCDDAERWMAWIVRDAEQRGDYRWGGGDRQFSLGLFRGLAGIAYTALRRIEPHLSNVLIWE
jgi:lantibiotic modifying enzyme